MWRIVLLLLAAGAAQAAPFAYIANSDSNNVSVIDTATNTVSAIIPVGSGPNGVAVNPAASRVYVGNYNSNNVSVIDPAANLVVAIIPVGNGPTGLALNPSGTRLFVTNLGGGNVSVVDTAANLVIANIPTRGFGIAVNPAGTRAYMPSGDCSASSATGGRCLGRLNIIDTSNNLVVANLTIEGSGTGVVVNPSGSRAYVVASDSNGGRLHVVDTGSNTLAATTNLPSTASDGPWSVAINPTGTRLYVTDWAQQNVLVVDTSSNIVIATVPMGGGSYPFGISVTPAGDRAYVTRRDLNDVIAIDLASNTTLATIRVGQSPRSFGTFIGTPAGASTIAPSASIQAGGFHTCGLDSRGNVTCWGDNSAGQLGDGSTTNRSTPAQVASNIARIAAGRQDHTCAIATDTSVKCWGNNAFGQLGDGTTTNRSSPVNGPGTATAISAGGYHTCKIGGDTVTKCWGSNSSGQLGNGSTTNSSTAVIVSGLQGTATAIATGFSHSCALSASGGVFCWGDNTYGQVGDGSFTNRTSAVPAIGLSSGVTAIALGAYHSCAILNGGSIRCWGRNDSGQVGDGTTINRATAVGVVGGATAIAGGGFHTCAVFSGGAASCWGQGGLGQLGDGSNVDRASPVSVVGLGSGVAGIKAGGFHSCARMTDGGVRCWGSSSSGQIGDGGLSAHPVQRYVVGAGGSGYLDLTPEDPVAGPPVSSVPGATPPLGIVTTGSITSAFANVTSTVTFRPQDVGRPYFVYFLAPATLAKSVDGSARTGFEPLLTPKDGPQCVLARLTPNGLVRSDPGALTATGNVTTSAGQAITVLNNVATSQVAGATACVGTGTSGAQAVTAGNNQCVVTIQGTQTCVSNDDTALGPAANTPGAFSGLWYNASESGWGINFTQRRNILFAAWYTYDGTGGPKWYVASSCTFTSTTATGGSCSGSLYEVSGPTFFGTSFNPSAANVRSAGTMSVDFTNTSSGTLTYTANGQTRTVSIVRQVFGSGTTPPVIDYTDLWWNSAESGWGMAITQQYGVMFLAWYVYDNTGKPVWYVASSCNVTSAGNGCSGTLYRTTGPPLGPTFNPSQVQVFTAGSVTLTFGDANNGTLSYTVNGVTASKTITRQLF